MSPTALTAEVLGRGNRAERSEPLKRGDGANFGAEAPFALTVACREVYLPSPGDDANAWWQQVPVKRGP